MDYYDLLQENLEKLGSAMYAARLFNDNAYNAKNAVDYLKRMGVFSGKKAAKSKEDDKNKKSAPCCK